MAFPGSGYMIVNDVANLISNILVEPVVSTTLGTAVTPGSQTVTPGSMASIYVGAMLIVDTGTAQEVVTVTAVTTSTFTAVFANAHAGTAAVVGATFPVGENNNYFFSQAEVLGQISDSQNVFLTRAPIVLNVVTQDFQSAQKTSALPADCVQLERVAVGGKALWEQGQTSADLINKYWGQNAPATPDWWFEDRVAFMTYGVTPIPLNAFAAELVYAQRDSEVLALNEGFLLPDPFLLYVMYGALAELFGKDGEQRDPARQAYCNQRFDLGVQVANRVYANIMQQQTVEGG